MNIFSEDVKALEVGQFLRNQEVNIEARFNQTRVDFKDDKFKVQELVNGSIDANIVLNAEDKQYINEECDETKKLLDEERETKREMYFRHARVLYPDVQEPLLSLAVDAFMEKQERGIDITTHKFDKDADKY
jgi:hypothetical protein